MKILLFACAIALHAPAQEGRVEIPEGREVRQRKLLTLGKSDSWHLEVERGEFLWCKVSSDTFDPVLTLVDSDGNELASDDGEGTRSELQLRSPVAGKVSLQVKGYQGSGGGPYDFWLQRFRIDPIDAQGEAQIELDASRWHHWAVELEAGQIFVPRVTGEGRLIAVFDLQQRTPPAVFGGYRIDRDGTWFVRVEGPRAARPVQLHCSLAEQRPMPDGGTGETVVGSHGMHVWRLRAEPGDAYAVRLRMPESQLLADLRERPGTAPDARGRAFVWTASADKGGDRQAWLVVRRRCELEYFVRQTGSEAAPYCLDFQVVTQTLASAVAFRGDLDLGGARCFALDTQPGELLRIRMQSDAFDARFELWGPDGTVLQQVDDRGPLDRDAELTLLIDRPGTHRILASSHGGGAGAFELRAESVAIPELQLGAGITVELRAAQQEYLQLHLAAGDEVWLSTRSAACDTALTVLAPDGTRLGTWGGGGIGDDVLQGLTARQGGRHTLLVHAAGGNGPCNVRAQRAHQ